MTYYVRQGGPFSANTYLILSETNGLLIVDPTDAAYICSVIEWKKCTPLAVLLTHGHFDHISGLSELLEQYPIPVYLHTADRELLNDPIKSGLRLFFPNAPYRQIQGEVHSVDKETLTFDGFNPIKVYHTPGHTRGSVCYLFSEPNQTPTMFTGDTLFAGSIGRTDLYGGSATEMRQSLHILSELPDELTVCPGHGPSTDIGSEKKCNPYFN